MLAHLIPRNIGTICDLAADQLTINAARGAEVALGGVAQIEIAITAAVKPASSITSYAVRLVETHDGTNWHGVPTQRRGTNTTALAHTFQPLAAALHDVLVVPGPLGGLRQALEVTPAGLAPGSTGDTGDEVTATATILD